MLLILCVGILVLAVKIQPVEAATIIVPDDYPTIQAAINAATAGDTIFVRNGTYHESIIITKPLSLVGENNSDTIINGGGVYGVQAVVEVQSDNVTVAGFTITGSDPLSGCGVLLPLPGLVGIGYPATANNCNVSDNVIVGNSEGIEILGVTGDYICGNTIANNSDVGLAVRGGAIGSVFCGNTIINNGGGVLLMGMEATVFENNSIANNAWSCGLFDDAANDVIDTSNLVDGKPLYFLANQEDAVINPPEFSEVGYLALQSSTNVTVTDLSTEGISLSSCTNCTITNSTSSKSGTGICLISSSNNTVSNDTLTNNSVGVSVEDGGGNNTIIGNDISFNWQGVVLSEGVEDNFVLNNWVVDNENLGIFLGECWGAVIFHNNFINNSAYEFWSNEWDNGYPSGGNYWSDYNGTDQYSGQYQNVIGSDGIGDTPHSICSENGNDFDHYPLMSPWLPQDVIRTSVLSSRTIVYQGLSTIINVTVINIGNGPENAWVALYYDTASNSSIGAYPVNLQVGQNFSFIVTWNAENVPVNTYTFTAVTTTPAGSTTLYAGNITVRIIGDVNGDGRVDLRDIALVARAFGATPTSPNWNPAADINGDGIINMQDITLVARHFGQHSP